jgi:type I restriction enzyme M protein
MFEQAFKNIDDVLRREAGCTTELDYTEQTSWLLFLKYLDDLEHVKATEAELAGRKYTPILDKPYRWEGWAAPKDNHGDLDHNKAITGDDLRDFVSGKLFPYLHGFKQKATGPNTLEYKIGEIFGEIKNKIQSGYNLREIIDHIDELRFRSQKEKHELSHLYEAKIRNMGNAGRNGGEYYTPRPLIRAIVQVVKPRIGERIYDGAVGSAGFLCESFEYLRVKPGLTTKEATTLQERTFYGKEKKSLAYVIAIMNMILHGIEAPNIIHTNTLTENLADIQEKDRVEVVMANPPFGGGERKEVQQNFPIRTGETAFLFLQHFIKMLKAGGRGGVVIKNTFLSNTDNASASLRKLLLESCNLHTVLDCPGGTFQGAGVKTVVLFFEKGAPTRRIWYCQLDPGRSLGKTNPLNDDDLAEFVKLQKTFADSPKSWTVDAKTIDKETFDLSVKNPNGGEEVKHRSPQDIMDEIATLDAESANNEQDRAHLQERQQNLDRTTHSHTEVIDSRHHHNYQRRHWLGRGEGELVAPKVSYEQRRGQHGEQESQKSHEPGSQGSHGYRPLEKRTRPPKEKSPERAEAPAEVDIGASCLRKCRAQFGVAKSTQEHDQPTEDPCGQNKCGGADGTCHVAGDKKNPGADRVANNNGCR